jgi:hypothetical protein
VKAILSDIHGNLEALRAVLADLARHGVDAVYCLGDIVGSVGQPRDGDWRACYVLLDGYSVRFRRVEYDIEKINRDLGEFDNPDDFE